MPITSGPTPATAHDRSASSGRRPRRSASSRVVTTHIAAPSFWPLALPAVTVDSASSFCAHRSQRGELLEGGLGTGVLVAVDDDVGLAAATRDGDRDELVGEPAGLVGGAGPLLGADRELVLLLARDVVLAAQVLGRLEHAAGDRVVLAAGGLAGADQAVHQLDAAAADAGAQAEGVVLDVGHRLDAAGDDDAAGTAGDLRRRRRGRPAGRSRSGGRAGGRVRRCRGRRRGRRCGRWPGSRRWGSSCPGSRRRRRPRRRPVRRTSSVEGGRRQVDGGQGGECAPEATHRGAYGFTDDDVGHGSNLIVTFDTVKYPFGAIETLNVLNARRSADPAGLPDRGPAAHVLRLNRTLPCLSRACW